MRLACVQKRRALVAKEVELGRLLALPMESQPAYVRQFDNHGTRANTERLGLWLGNSLNHCLYTQGPFCATLLLKERLSFAPSSFAPISSYPADCILEH